MSIRVQSHVWETSPAKGSDLLVLLAIADFANDDGVAWPGVDTLARKARISKRQTQYCLRNLTTAGLLSIQENAGPKGTHLYKVEGVQNVQGADSARVQSVTQRDADSAQGGADFVPKGCNPLHPNRQEPPREPSGNRQSPPKPPKGDKTTIHDQRFESFWNHYPKRTGKEAARKWWLREKPSASLLDEMLEAIAKQRLSMQWLKDGGQYIPNPSTWLNQGRWQDDPEPDVPRNVTHLNGHKDKLSQRDASFLQWEIDNGLRPATEPTDVIDVKGTYR
jgi:hypothetical protein